MPVMKTAQLTVTNPTQNVAHRRLSCGSQQEAPTVLTAAISGTKKRTYYS